MDKSKPMYVETANMLNDGTITPSEFDEYVFGCDYSNGIDCTTEIYGRKVDGVIVITSVIRDCCNKRGDI